MPSPEKNEYKFSKHSVTWFVPLVIYFEFESFLKPVAGCDAATDQSSTLVIEKHEPCGFALAAVDITRMNPIFIMWTAQKIVWATLFECCIR